MIEKNVFELDFIPGISLLNKSEKNLHASVFSKSKTIGHVILWGTKKYYILLLNTCLL